MDGGSLVVQMDESRPSPVMSSRQGNSGETFGEFFRREFRNVVKVALLAGAATLDQAQDAAEQAMVEVMRLWPTIDYPAAYAKRTVLGSLSGELTVKDGQPAPDRIPPETSDSDDRQRVERIFEALPGPRREVMARVVDGLENPEICALLGRSPGDMRRRLDSAREGLERYSGKGYKASSEQRPPADSADPRQEDV